jgi:YjbR
MARRTKAAGMTAEDFRRIALSLDGAEEGSHMGAADFRVGGRIFATLASQAQGYGNLMLTPGEQAAFVEELPDVFVPIAGGWGRMGMTHIVLAKANEDLLRGALQTAWRLRVEANARSRKRRVRTTGDPVPTARRRTTRARR